MTEGGHDRQSTEGAKVAPETLELRGRPEPMARINRKVLIGAAAVVLIVISGLVLVALQPPTLRLAKPQELFNVETKPVTDALNRLPATYDGVRPVPNAEARKLPPGVPTLTEPSRDPAVEAERVEKQRLARMAGQAREAPVLFRLQAKASPRETNRAVAQTDPSSGRLSAATDPLALSALRAAENAQGLTHGDLDRAANDASQQTRKLAFLKDAPRTDVYNPHTLQTPASPYQLMAGTVIAASLVTGLNADLPGFVVAQVTENVFDTVSGRFLLIPQGARLVGKYDHVVAFGQERALVVWQRLILPDGSSIVIDNLPATDTGGYAGLADQVDLHTWTLLKGVALATILGVGSELAFGGAGSSGDSDLIRALQLSTQSTTNRAGQRLVERNLNVQPTITVRPGWPLRVIVHKDIVLRPYQARP